jgi:cold shock CspA family protein
MLLLNSAHLMLRMNMHGVVKWFSHERGYGFITDERDKDYYFAVHDVVGAELPYSGDEVDFDLAKTGRGLRAQRVRITRKASRGRGDERETCDHCGKKMVPRIISCQGAVQRSVCPYCGETHRRVAIPRFVLVGVVMIAVVILSEC